MPSTQERRGRRPRHGRTPVRRGAALARRGGRLAGDRAVRGGRRRLRPGRAVRATPALGPRAAGAAGQRLRRRRPGRAAARQRGHRASTGPPRRSPPPTGEASATTRWCWPPVRTRSCRRCPGTTCPAASSTAPSTTSTASVPPRRRAAGRAPVGVVVGGGLLGLEAANALRQFGLTPHVVEHDAAADGRSRSTRGAARCSAGWSPSSGSTVHTGVGTESRHRSAADRRPVDGSMRLSDGTADRRRRWWCSPPVCARATSWPATPGSRSASAAACSPICPA